MDLHLHRVHFLVSSAFVSYTYDILWDCDNFCFHLVGFLRNLWETPLSPSRAALHGRSVQYIYTNASVKQKLTDQDKLTYSLTDQVASKCHHALHLLCIAAMENYIILLV